MTYSASLDNLAKSITIAVIMLMFVPVLYGIVDMLDEPFRLQHLAIPILIIIVETTLLLLCHAFAPQSYTLTGNTLTINRTIQPLVFNLSDIADLELLGRNALYDSIRTFGSGGLWGYFGKYWHPQHGKIKLYTTRSTNRILITFNNNERIVISPDSLEMMNELTSSFIARKFSNINQVQ